MAITDAMPAFGAAPATLNPRSILFITNLFPPNVAGGAEMSAFALAKGFAARGVEVSVFTLKQDGPATISFESGLRVYRHPAHLPYWPFDQKDHSKLQKIAFHAWDNFNLTANAQISDVIRAVKPDIVSTQGLVGISAAAWRATARAGVPIVHSIRDYNALCPRSTMYRNAHVCAQQCADCKILTIARKRLSGLVDGVVANSAHVRDQHQAAGYFPSAWWEVVPPTIDPVNISAEPSLNDGPVRFGFAGRISRDKGLEWLIDALARIPGLDWECIVAGRGDPSYVQALQDKGGGRVKFLGWIAPDMFYKAIDVLVAPSLWAEPAGRVVAEAYAFGLPVIAAAHGGLVENVEAGVTGWLVTPGSVDELAEALSQACDPRHRQKLSKARMASIASDHSTLVAVERYAQMFATTLGRVRGAP